MKLRTRTKHSPSPVPRDGREALALLPENVQQWLGASALAPVEGRAGGDPTRVARSLPTYAKDPTTVVHYAGDPEDIPSTGKHSLVEPLDGHDGIITNAEPNSAAPYSTEPVIDRTVMSAPKFPRSVAGADEPRYSSAWAEVSRHAQHYPVVAQQSHQPRHLQQ